MAKKNYIFYQKTDPFPGWIRFVAQVDPNETPDGSTLKERYTQLLIKYPDSAIKQFPLGDLPDPEAVKYDEATETLVPLDVGDITPKAQAELDQAQKAQDIIDNLPSWSAVETAINNISSLAQAKAFMLKHARVTYWLAKNTSD